MAMVDSFILLEIFSPETLIITLLMRSFAICSALSTALQTDRVACLMSVIIPFSIVSFWKGLQAKGLTNILLKRGLISIVLTFSEIPF